MVSRVLLATTNYWPEPTGIAVYTTDLAETLQANGHQVSVLTSLPHYPWWKIPAEFNQLGEGKVLHNGVTIIRAKHVVPSRMHALTRVRFEFSLWWNLRRVSKKLLNDDFDLVIGCIPTVAAGIVGKKIAHQFGIPFGLIVQDLSGAGAKQSGLRGGVAISKIAQAVEGRVFQGANKLIVVSPAMSDFLAGFGVPESRITQISNYNARTISNYDKASARSRFGWSPDDFIVLHTGNMGAKQDLENVVQAAGALSVESNVKVYLVGHGNQEARLKSLCTDNSKILILPAVSDSDYSALLSAADLLLVNERPTQMEMSLPSKLTSYLYSNRPVIAAVPRGGATWKFLDGVAKLVEAANPIALADAIEELTKQPEILADLAERGRVFAESNLNPEVGREKYLNWVEEFVKF